MIVWAPWHPRHGYDVPDIWENEPVAFTCLAPRLLAMVRELNERDGTNNRNGWRATKTMLVRAP